MGCLQGHAIYSKCECKRFLGMFLTLLFRYRHLSHNDRLVEIEEDVFSRLFITTLYVCTLQY